MQPRCGTPSQASNASGPFAAPQPSACNRRGARQPACAFAAEGSSPRHHSSLALLRSSRAPQVRRRDHSHRRAGTVVTAAEKGAKVPVAERLANDDLQRWQDCVQMVVDCGVAAEEADGVLAKAFGWRGQGYWRKQKVDEVPHPDDVAAVLAFLAEQGVDEENIAAALARFPEVLALPVDSQLRANVEALQSQWFVRGLALKKLLRTQPQVLGYNVDCGGDCQGDCNRCWVRF